MNRIDCPKLVCFSRLRFSAMHFNACSRDVEARNRPPLSNVFSLETCPTTSLHPWYPHAQETPLWARFPMPFITSLWRQIMIYNWILRCSLAGLLILVQACGDEDDSPVEPRENQPPVISKRAFQRLPKSLRQTVPKLNVQSTGLWR